MSSDLASGSHLTSGSHVTTGPAATSGPAPASEGPASSGADDHGLSDRDRRILALEARTYRYVGAKERRIRDELGMTPTAYFVRLNALLENPSALRHSPALVNRLRGLRASSGGERPGPVRAA